jgi:hydroxypyruvate reductase/glycerate 2-kinase
LIWIKGEIPVIKNRAELISHGFVEGRQKVLDIAEYTLNHVDPLAAVKKNVTLDGSRLQVGEDTFDLNTVNKIYAIGGGKATYPLAVALEEILGDRITDGFIAIKKGQMQPFFETMGTLTRIRVAESAHPIPDETSLQAGKAVWQIAERAGQGDMVFCLMSGGVSAQCVYPVEGISLNDKVTINQLLVHSGADVTEIMTVRGHLSRIKGGRLAPQMLPATVISLTVSDEKTDSMEWNTDWASPDSTTLADAERVLKKYDLWQKVSEPVRNYFCHPTPDKETPKSFSNEPLYYCMVVKTRALWEAAAQRAKALGLTPVLLTTLLNGESREVGRTIASIANEIKLSGNPVRPPCALIATGETAVRIQGAVRGQGGANQELAVGACLDLDENHPIAICALDTDGTDGPTSLAGALTDGSTPKRAAQKGYDLFQMLMEHDVATVLKATGDAAITGPTGTNVNDLVICVIL